MSGRYFEERLLCWATASVARPTCLSIELPTLSWQEGRIRRPHVSLVPLCSCRAQHGCQVDYVTSHVSKKSKSQESRRNIKNTDINRRKLQKSWKTLKRQAFVQKTYKITPKGRNLATFLPWFSNSNVNASTDKSNYIGHLTVSWCFHLYLEFSPCWGSLQTPLWLSSRSKPCSSLRRQCCHHQN